VAVLADSQVVMPDAAGRLCQVAGRRLRAGEASRIVMHGGYRRW
jgi:hypothetical protein